MATWLLHRVPPTTAAWAQRCPALTLDAHRVCSARRVSASPSVPGRSRSTTISSRGRPWARPSRAESVPVA